MWSTLVIKETKGQVSHFPKRPNDLPTAATEQL